MERAMLVQLRMTRRWRCGDVGVTRMVSLAGQAIRQSSQGPYRQGPYGVAARSRVRRRTRCLPWLLVLLAACATGRRARNDARWTIPRTVADSITSERLASGVWLHHLVRTSVPLRVHVLDVDLASCVSVRALKGGSTAVGRTTTSDLLRAVASSDTPLAAVNADFFLFAPPGVPVGALVRSGQVIAGPIDRPVIAFDASNRPFIGVMRAAGTLTTSRARVPVITWNRPTANAIGVVDAAWGQALDSLSRPGAMMLVPLGERRYRIAPVPLAHSGLARGDTLMLVGSARASLLERDTVRVEVALGPVAPLEVVGGFPMLVHDSVIVTGVDSMGAASFRAVNPRTAAGFAANGRRLLLVVIDGRQNGYSAGTTTRETAALLRDLGAREALNLDGGGSTAMVVRRADTGFVQLVNRPSDAAGERPVADALAVLGVCRASRP
ncbi:MAG: phosphodiester glycosidase family protein [Gemmatimonadaceae bacterium]|nr:phosphodiester glycosidase family protein [Gemmatimonadaceae bacterium]